MSWMLNGVSVAEVFAVSSGLALWDSASSDLLVFFV